MSQPHRPGLTTKALLVGVILIPLNAAWQMIGLRWDIAHMSMISLLYNTVSLLFLMTVWSRLIQPIIPSLSLSRADLLTIYTMVSLSTAIGGHMCVQMLPPIISYTFAYASPENDWQALFWHYIPDWTSVQDRRIVGNFFAGQSTFYTSERLRAWLSPLARNRLVAPRYLSVRRWLGLFNAVRSLVLLLVFLSFLETATGGG